MDTEILATFGPCCGILRRGMNEPNVMHNGLCREKHDGCLGQTIYLVDAAEVERLRAELAACRSALAKVGPYYVPATSVSDEEAEEVYAAIDAARKGKGE